MADLARHHRRIKISLTVDPVLLQAVDEFVAEQPSSNRSRVVEDALRLWQGRQLEQALEAQYAEPLTEEQEREMAAWRHIRQAAVQQRSVWHGSMRGPWSPTVAPDKESVP